MNKTKTTAIVSVIACVVLASSLVGVVLNHQAIEQQKEEEYRDLYFQFLNETRIAYEYWENWTRWQKAEVNQTEITPEDQHYFLKQHAELYTTILNGYDPRTLTTVVVHCCEKAESENIHFPNVAYTYQKIRDGFAPYEVLILPEYKGNLNWTETLYWISTNFTEVPICLSVFEGGSDKLPNPNVNLAIAEIEQAMLVADVRMIRFAEMISWYINASQTIPNVAFPINDIRDILEFCRSKNLRVIWNEWKISDDVLPWLNSTLYGYEDIVTLVYQTNNEYDEPFIGFLYATQFEHWGASVQSWYWEEHGYGPEGEMPLELIVEHAILAKNMGAEIIQFEPYWYFFDNGEPLEAMHKMWSTI